MKKLYLHDYHKNNLAQFSDLGGWQLPVRYQDVTTELDCLKNSVGLIDRSFLGILRMTGPDSIDLLNRISTNDLKRLSLSPVCDTVFPTPKGRIMDFCRVFYTNPELLLVSSAADAQHLRDWINRFVIMEDVVVEKAEKAYLFITVAGPESTAFLNSLAGSELFPASEVSWIENEGLQILAAQNKQMNVPAYDICMPAVQGKLWMSMSADLLIKTQGCWAGQHAFEILRLESGMPGWGSELNEEYNPHEAGLLSAVSFTKGCYTGQEVLARLDTYDKVQKYLMRFDLEEATDGLPLDLWLDNEKVGRLTSYAHDPATNRHLGLGYVKKNVALAAPGIQVEIDNGSRRTNAILKAPPVQFGERNT